MNDPATRTRTARVYCSKQLDANRVRQICQTLSLHVSIHLVGISTLSIQAIDKQYMKTSAHVPFANCAEAASPGARVYEQLAAAIGAMRFGSVEITVHDGRVVQIEKREKVRLEPWGNNQFRPTT